VPDIDHRLDAPIVTATDRVRDLLATQPDADLLAARLVTP
jgi:hypothetical protein